jgi:hypothetical protein
MEGSEYLEGKLKIWLHLIDSTQHRTVGRGSEEDPMERHLPEVVGVRRTGWAALDRDPQQDVVEFTCPHCGAKSQKKARRERTEYKFTDGFLQDLQGEGVQCHLCKQSLRIVPVVMLHDQDETRRFAAVFSDEPLVHAE